MPAFVSGQQLSREFYRQEVRPVLDAAFPGLPHSAALLGRGSDVLGFDDAMSQDHDWRARVLLFLREEDLERHGAAAGESLRRELPARFRDHPTEHTIVSLRGYLLDTLGVDVDGEIEARDWLTFPEQELCMLTAGAVHHDDVGLQAIRDRLAYYPRDVWLYLMMAAWWRVHPEPPWWVGPGPWATSWARHSSGRGSCTT